MYWEFSTKFVGTIIGTSTELARTEYRKPESLLYGFSLSHGFIVSCKVCHLSWATGTELWISSCVLLVFIIIFFKSWQNILLFLGKVQRREPKRFLHLFLSSTLPSSRRVSNDSDPMDIFHTAVGYIKTRTRSTASFIYKYKLHPD